MERQLRLTLLLAAGVGTLSLTSCLKDKDVQMPVDPTTPTEWGVVQTRTLTGTDDHLRDNERIEETYNKNGQLLSRLDYSLSATGEATLVSREVNTYDADGYLTESLEETTTDGVKHLRQRTYTLQSLTTGLKAKASMRESLDGKLLREVTYRVDIATGFYTGGTERNYEGSQPVDLTYVYMSSGQREQVRAVRMFTPTAGNPNPTGIIYWQRQMVRDWLGRDIYREQITYPIPAEGQPQDMTQPRQRREESFQYNSLGQLFYNAWIESTSSNTPTGWAETARYSRTAEYSNMNDRSFPQRVTFTTEQGASHVTSQQSYSIRYTYFATRS